MVKPDHGMQYNFQYSSYVSKQLHSSAYSLRGVVEGSAGGAVRVGGMPGEGGGRYMSIC